MGVISGSIPNSSTTAYAAGSDMVNVFDWRAISDLLLDPSTRTGNVTPPPDSNTTVGYFATNLIGDRALRWASGEIEAAATRGQRYLPQDLLELTQLQLIPLAQGGDGVTTAYMVGRDTLVVLTCTLAFWYLKRRRNPGAKIGDFDCVVEAYRMLDALEKGERIFQFGATQAAGLPDEEPLDANAITDTNAAAEPISWVASRMFGSRNGR